MKLLLHACCGPCSLEPSRILRQAGHDLAIYYANSNIAPTGEYEHRLSTLREWAESEGLPVVEGHYNPAAWEACAGRIGDAALDEARKRQACSSAAENNYGRDAKDTDDAHKRALPLSVDPAKREARCRACYRLRLEEAAQYAAQAGFDGVGTTLSVSPYQYTDIIREEVERAATQVGITAVFEDFRPFYDEATRRSRELGMYRQNYCGCRFSDDEAAAERAERKAARTAAREAKRAAHADELAAKEADRAAKRAERAAYEAKQAHKHAVLKALREQGRLP